MTDPPIKTICAWCGTTIREGTIPPSHGICPACFEKLLPKEKTNG